MTNICQREIDDGVQQRKVATGDRRQVFVPETAAYEANSAIAAAVWVFNLFEAT